MTKQKIPDGDLMGFDASAVEAERPEVREPRQPRGGQRGQKPQKAQNGGDSKTKAEHENGGRKDKGKDAGKDQPAKPRRDRKRRSPKGDSAAASPAVPALPPNRDPEEFLDDEIDNFGNRVDYVSPNQNKSQSRGRRGGSGSGGSQGAARPANKPPRNNGGAKPAGQQAGKGRRQGGGGQGRNGAGGSRRPAHDGRITSLDRDELPRAEAAVRNPRERQPLIVHKSSRLDRFPTPEQLDELANGSRPRGEKPALLTRNRDE